MLFCRIMNELVGCYVWIESLAKLGYSSLKEKEISNVATTSALDLSYQYYHD